MTAKNSHMKTKKNIGGPSEPPGIMLIIPVKKRSIRKAKSRNRPP
jgi:hypothetical protein